MFPVMLADSAPNKTLTIVYVVLGVIGVLIVVFFLSGAILWPIVKNREKAVYKAFETVKESENRRKVALKAAMDQAKAAHLPYKKEFFDAFEEAIASDPESPDAMRKPKDTLDFGFLYVKKLFLEKGKRTPAKETAKSLDEALAASDKVLLAFGKTAGAYNALLSLLPVRFINWCHKPQNKLRKIPLI